jgi:hypothetical protein
MKRSGWRSFWIFASLLLWAIAAAAQQPATAPPEWKGELFGGYSSVNAPAGPTSDRATQHGWTASFTSYSVFRRWGLTAEFGGTRKDGGSQQSYLFGGTYRGLARRRFALTGRVLAGVTRAHPPSGATNAFPRQSAFSFGFGQSIDWRFSRRFALRVQPDLRWVRFKDTEGSSRMSLVRPLSVGLVYQFGKR